VPFPTKLLNENESIVLDLHPHWWYFAEAAAALAISILLGIVGLAFGWPSWLNSVILLAIVISAIWLISRYAKWISTSFVLTSFRIIYRSGLFAKRGIEIPLERVNNVNFNQGIFERIIGAGDLLIESAGEMGQSRFTDIRHPEAVKGVISRQIDLTIQANRAVVVQQTDAASQLEKLHGLLQRGAISQEEYDAQKAKLLGS
jgi:uncharacterized membrane protein YdbT with pleckstrin-like domain